MDHVAQRTEVELAVIYGRHTHYHYSPFSSRCKIPRKPMNDKDPAIE